MSHRAYRIERCDASAHTSADRIHSGVYFGRFFCMNAGWPGRTRTTESGRSGQGRHQPVGHRIEIVHQVPLGVRLAVHQWLVEVGQVDAIACFHWPPTAHPRSDRLSSLVPVRQDATISAPGDPWITLVRGSSSATGLALRPADPARRVAQASLLQDLSPEPGALKRSLRAQENPSRRWARWDSICSDQARSYAPSRAEPTMLACCGW